MSVTDPPAAPDAPASAQQAAIGAALPDDARARLPREPYPGLRPFLDFEAALLFGRERQVREVIDRLRQTQFVAVLGGSGSGKSSLIHAGVVPELRSFGIPGAGDLWLPMTCTPGTNVGADDSAARRHSPITRLARRFAGLLRSRGSSDADTARNAEIADVFRQEAGFARLLDTYGKELAVPPGPDPAEARVLFVLDQFEEIFHPTNKGVEDGTLLVERVLDHFFNPHPRCHVILTMRSEHLNDCATFLELPDAINKSSYLIRRLDDTELRDAITGPAQRFLRLVARSEQAAGGERSLPQEVQFEPQVLERLLRDVKAITHDPDHLPLLQHLLARLWEAALEREEMDVPVPSHVTEIDLVRAISAGGAPGDEQPLDERTNTLRACVDNWPESIYRWHDAAQRAQIDALFRHLAFKDPNTGLYLQQRIDVDGAAQLLGHGHTRADLRTLVAEGFLGSVDYLFWDAEDPARVTLKVSHESFIRGWQRFRRLIDVESAQFEEYVGVLHKAAIWTAGGRSDDDLLEAGEMRRLRESAFESRLAQPAQRAAWMRFLQITRDGTRLAKAEPQLDAFMATSNRRLQQRENQATRRRRNWLLLGAVILLLLPSALFSILIQAPVMKRAELLFDAGNRANRAPLTPDYPGVGAAAGPLDSLLRAAELIDDARTGQGLVMTRLSQWLLKHLAWMPAVHRQDAFLSGVAAQAEPPVNGKLRQLLTSAVWRSEPQHSDDTVIDRPAVLDVSCTGAPGGSDTAGAEVLQGRLFVAATRSGSSLQRRAVFVPAADLAANAPIVLRGASYDMVAKRCTLGQIVLAIPRYLEPSVVFDAGLRYFAYTAYGQSVEVPSVTVQEIDWERVEDNSSRIVQSEARTVLTSGDAVQQVRSIDAVEQVRQAAGEARVAVVDSWRKTAGRALAVGAQPWRMVSPAAQRLPVAVDDPQFTALQPVAPDTPCAQLRSVWTPQPGFRLDVLEHGNTCFAISRGNAAGASVQAAANKQREQVLVAVYERPDADSLARLAENPPAPIASLNEFARVNSVDDAWFVGTAGPYAGWLALRGNDAAGTARLVGAPWSTCALWHLGRELQRNNPPPATPARLDDALSARSSDAVCNGR